MDEKRADYRHSSSQGVRKVKVKLGKTRYGSKGKSKPVYLLLGSDTASL